MNETTIDFAKNKHDKTNRSSTYKDNDMTTKNMILFVIKNKQQKTGFECLTT